MTDQEKRSMRFTLKRIDIASISSRSRRYFELDTEEFFSETLLSFRKRQ